MFVLLQVWNCIIKAFQSLKIYRISLFTEATWSQNTYLSVHSTSLQRFLPFTCCLFWPLIFLPLFWFHAVIDIFGNINNLYGFCHSFFFKWSVVDLQCCVNFYCTAEWFSYTYAYILFSCSFPSWSIIGYEIEFPVLHSRTLSFHFLLYGCTTATSCLFFQPVL